MFNNNSSNRSMLPPPVKFIFFLAFAALALFVVGNIIMYLWNEILAEATGVKPLNFWESLGLLLLSRILVGGFRFGSSRRPWKKSHKRPWKEKWMQMSQEDRSEFRNKWRERCGKE